MKFCVSRMYCKYVINALSKAVLKIRSISIKDEALEDELYQSYLKLEKLLKQVVLNFTIKQKTHKNKY